MNNLKNIVEKARGLHGSIAQDVFPNGAVLRCSVCGKQVDITTDECEQYLAHGWPKCCDYGMILERNKEEE